jgi:hypothetical protein
MLSCERAAERVSLQCGCRRFLDVSANQLYGTIPSSLGAMQSLTYDTPCAVPGCAFMSVRSCRVSCRLLDLEANQLSGVIPQSLADLTGLS